ncbi:MAG: hypothetical protein COX57_02125 [Alphaproteobacteria bacterium CG_4_10_14_0_2_um_filter_63_37]|nr:MAG: hypothetical protein AUJ55_06715 [Proteobacteria bacterium CG1_02_64_396]PJA25660.1 MAG: hypothetical protein COX57_02125 [Alphaproteobacteria bacterium CG_4_10_14_0_2_um_filter_63_37]
MDQDYYPVAHISCAQTILHAMEGEYELAYNHPSPDIVEALDRLGDLLATQRLLLDLAMADAEALEAEQAHARFAREAQRTG